MNGYRNISLTKEQIQTHLQVAAKSYARYSGKILLFIYQKNIRSNCEMLKVRFGQENFMHLVGIRSKTLSATDFYFSCIHGSVGFEDCTPSHDSSNRNSRILLLPKMTDFSKCKIYSIAEKTANTIQNDFHIACGNQSGIIGFDYRGSLKSSDIAIPTTLLSRPLSYYCSNPMRILFVYELVDSKKYSTIYEIKDGLYNTLLSEGKISEPV